MGLIGTWPADVRREKARIDVPMQSTHASTACPQLPAATRGAWTQFYLAWAAFRDEDPGWFGSGAAYDEALAYERRLIAWQTEIARHCAIIGPVVKPTDAPSADVGETTSDAIKWVAGAAIVVALVYGVRTVLR